MNIFPIYCIICYKEANNYICKDCINKFEYTLPICSVCKKISTQGIIHYNCINKSKYQLLTGYKYTDISKKILHMIKYKGCIPLLDILINNLINGIQIDSNTLIIPVPMHWIKRLERGFNLTDEITMRISKKYNLKYRLDLLEKYRDRSAQANTKKTKRRENVINSFRIKNINGIKNLNSIMIIDDVITTQSTVDEITRIIKQENKNISIKVFCLFSAIR